MQKKNTLSYLLPKISEEKAQNLMDILNKESKDYKQLYFKLLKEDKL
jgi:hypothetical protein